MKIVLPHLYRKFSISAGDICRDYLVLNRESGARISTKSIRSSMHKFCNTVGGEIHVTPSILRDSYASLMVREYVAGAEKVKFLWVRI